MNWVRWFPGVPHNVAALIPEHVAIHTFEHFPRAAHSTSSFGGAVTSLDGVHHRGSVLDVCPAFDWIFHCTVNVFSMDAYMDMDTWKW